MVVIALACGLLYYSERYTDCDTYIHISSSFLFALALIAPHANFHDVVLRNAAATTTTVRIVGRERKEWSR